MTVDIEAGIPGHLEQIASLFCCEIVGNAIESWDELRVGWVLCRLHNGRKLALMQSMPRHSGATRCEIRLLKLTDDHPLPGDSDWSQRLFEYLWNDRDTVIL